MKYLILLAILGSVSANAASSKVPFNLTDKSVGYDQKAFDACVDSCTTDGECEACDAIVEAGI